MSGTIEIKTRRLLLRKQRPEDADVLYENFGVDSRMFEYSGWNPYQTREMASLTVAEYIKNYDKPGLYAWAIEHDGRLIGIIGAYNYEADKDRIEVGLTIEIASWGYGYATEALTAVLRYLTEQEQISIVTAWCATDNVGSRRAMEKSGMLLVLEEKNGLEIEDKKYDKLVFEYTL